MRRTIPLLAVTAMLLIAGAPAGAQTPSPSPSPSPTTAPAPSPAAQPARARVVLFWVDGTTIGDWTQPGLPNFAAVLAHGSSALLSTWTGTADAGEDQMRVAAAADVGLANVRGRVPLSTRPSGFAFRLGDALAARGHPAEVVGSATDGTSALNLVIGQSGDMTGARPGGTPSPVVRADANFPSGARTDPVLAIAAVRKALVVRDVVVVDVGDTARVERVLGTDEAARAPWMRLAMRRADGLLGAVRASLTPRDTLIVISGTPPVSAQRAGVRLGAIAFEGSRWPAGVLRSPTTRTDGLVALEDVPATIMAVFGIPHLDTLTGAEVRPSPARDPAGALRALARRLETAHDEHRSVTRGLLIAMMIAVALGALLWLFGIGRPASADGVPRTARDVVALLAIAIAFAPATFLLTGSFGAIVGAVAAIALAFVVRMWLSRERALIAAFAASPAVMLVDALTDGGLGMRAALGIPVATGARSHGADAIVLGFVAAAVVFGGALALDSAREPTVPGLCWIAGGLVIAWAFAVPFGGNTPAGIAVIVPATAILGMRALNARLDARSITAIVMLTLTAFGVVAVAIRPTRGIDTLTPLLGKADFTYAARVRIHAAWDVLGLTMWPLALVVCASGLALMVWTRRDAAARAMWGRPHLRAAWIAAAVASIAAVVGVRGGVITAAVLLGTGAVATTALLVAPDR